MIGLDIATNFPGDHVLALRSSVNFLTDTFTDDLHYLESGEDFIETTMSEFLPRKNLPRYDLMFAKKFFVCTEVVAWKLFSTHEESLACVAEELALNALIQEASQILFYDGVEVDYTLLYDLAFRDKSFEMLFDERWDGIEDIAIERAMHNSLLRFEDWFFPFDDTTPIHPFVTQYGDEELPPKPLL